MARWIGGKKHSRYAGLLTAHRRLSQRKQLRHAALAAMVCEDSPVATSELGLQAREIIGGGRHRAFRIEAVVAHGDGVRNAMTNRAVDRRSGLAAHQLPLGSDL